MERGRWGHSAEFNRFQTGTPAVIYVPGRSRASSPASPATSTSRPP
jgi:membrane-anchored protein YejM (alkaline phosphatase superfamily)